MLSVQPCIPNDWREYKIDYRYKTSIYHITVKNPNGKNTGVTSFIVNGKEVEEKQIRLQEDGRIYNIEVVL